MTLGIVLIVYGLLNCLGGILAFFKARSIPSLIAGDLAGTLLIVAGVFHFWGAPWAASLGLGITVLLCVVFGMRYAKTRKWMPAGMLLGLSLVVLVLLLSMRG